MREIAQFRTKLYEQRDEIRRRVHTINESLVRIDYKRGTYIALEPNDTPNTEIRLFRDELRTCTDNSLGGDGSDQYAEEKFLDVSRIIERFAGRDGRPTPTGRGRGGSPTSRVVHLLRVRTQPRRRHRARALHELRRQVGWAEGEAGLHDPGGVAGLPVQARGDRRRGQDVPVRRHREAFGRESRASTRSGSSCSADSACSC